MTTRRDQNLLCCTVVVVGDNDGNGSEDGGGGQKLLCCTVVVGGDDHAKNVRVDHSGSAEQRREILPVESIRTGGLLATRGAKDGGQQVDERDELVRAGACGNSAGPTPARVHRVPILSMC